MKYLQFYSTRRLGCTTVTCVVHPRARDFYIAFWSFVASKKIVKYKFVNNALGVQLAGDITEDKVRPMINNFPAQADRNPIKFILAATAVLKYPDRVFSNHFDPIFSPRLLKYFLFERSNAHTKLSARELVEVLSAYKLFFDDMEGLESYLNSNLMRSQPRSFRFPVNSPAVLADAHAKSTGHIMDISTDGAFFSTEEEVTLGKEYLLEFSLGSAKISSLAVAVWHNRQSRNHQSLGYGIKFRQPQLDIGKILKETHLTGKVRRGA